MAKKTEKEPVDFAGLVLAQIKKQYGDVVHGGDEMISQERMVIPFSPALDPILGGGIPEGSWVTLSGRYGSGKSTAAMRFAANCQKPEWGSRPIYYLSIEGRFDEKIARGTRGLTITPPAFNVVESTEDHMLTAQDFLRIGDLILKTHPRAVLILDSPSMFASEEAHSEGVDYQNRGQINKQFGEFVRQNVQTVKVKKSIVISCIHLQRTQGPFASWSEKVAESCNYACNVKLRIQYDKPLMSDNKQIGQILKWEVDKSALSGPGGKADGYIRYGIGIDCDYERLLAGVDLGLVGKSGSWFTMDFSKGERAQGLENAWSLLQENPELAKALQQKIDEMLNPVAA